VVSAYGIESGAKAEKRGKESLGVMHDRVIQGESGSRIANSPVF
jgi:hypothetical protein